MPLLRYCASRMKGKVNSKKEVGVPPELERYLELCIRMYERMERENSWPWVTDPNGWKHGDYSKRSE
jgi:hypothetical protein